MKETVNVKIGGTNYELYLTIGDMRRVEKELGQSILSVMSGDVQHLLQEFGIDVVVALLKYAIHDKLHGKRTDAQVYDIIQQYCDDGNDLDRLSGMLISVIWNTGLFGQIKAPRKNAKTETAKESSKSAPSKNG